MKMTVTATALAFVAALGLFPLVSQGYSEPGATSTSAPAGDPAQLAAQAKAFAEKKQWAEAVKAYEGATARLRDADLFLGLAKARWEWLLSDRSLPDAIRQALLTNAYAACAEALRLNPNHIDALNFKAAIEFIRGQRFQEWDGYIATVTRLLELQPHEAELYYKRAAAKAEKAKVRPEYAAGAIEDFRAATREAPTKEEYWCGLIAYLQSRGMTKDVEPAILASLRVNPNSLQLRAVYAEYLVGEKRAEEALKYLQEAIDIQPNKAAGYFALAAYYYRQGDLGKTEQAIRTAIEKEPADVRPYLFLSRVYADKGDQEGSVKLLHQGIEAVEGALSKIDRTKSPDLEREHQVGLLQLNHQLCDVLLDGIKDDSKKKVVDQVEVCLKSMQRFPDHPFVTKIQGRLKLIEGNYVEAEKLLRAAYDRMSRYDIRTAQLLIYLYNRLDQKGEQQKVLEQYIVASGDDPRSTLTLAGLYVEYHQYDQALRLVKTVVKNHPGHKTALGMQAGLEAIMGGTEGVPPEIKRGELDSYSAKLFLARAAQLWSEGRRAPAENMAKDVLDRDPRNLAALIQLITWASSSNQPEALKALMAHAQNVFGDNKDTMNRLMQITETDPEKRLQARMLLIEQEDKPLTRAMMKADVYREMQMPARYFAALQEAEKIAPQDQSVIEALFDYYLSKTPPDVDKAKGYADVAVAADFDKVEGRTFKARLAMAQKNYDEAARLLQETLGLRPRFSDAYALLGNCHLAGNKLDQAKEAYTTALQQNPASVRALMGLLAISETNHARADRAKLVEQLYQFVPNDPNIREKYIELQEERGDRPENLIAQRTQMRQLQPGNLTNLVRLAALLERADRVNPADEVYRAILTETKCSSPTMRGYVDFLHRNQQDAKALTQLQEFVTKANTPTRKTEAYVVWAGYLANCKEDANALAMFDKAIAADTDGTGLALTGLATYWADRQQWAKAAESQAQYLVKAGDKALPKDRLELIGYYIEGALYQQAEKLVDESLAKEPGDLQLLSLRALSAIRQKQFDRAAQDLEKVLTLSPNYGAALTYRALLHQAQGDLPAAAADLEAAMRSHFTPVVAMQLADAYDGILDFANAYGVLQNILREQPYYTQAMRALVRLCRKYQRTPLLDQALATALKAYPNDPFFLLEQAQRDLQLNRSAEAIKELNQAAIGAPSDVSILLALMQANVQAGNPQAALDGGKGLAGNAEVGPQALAVSGRANILLKNEVQADANFAAALKAAKTRDQRVFILAQVRESYPSATTIERLQKWSALLEENWQLREAIGDVRLATLESGKMNKDEVARAIADCSAALVGAQENADRVRILKKLALAQYGLGLLEESRQNYNQVLKLAPRDAEVMNNMAWMLAFDLKKVDEAVPYAEQAAALMPDNANVLDTYGMVLCQRAAGGTDASAKNKDYEKAREMLNRSVEILAMPANRLHLGNAYEKLKRNDEALSQYLKAWDLVKDKPASPHYAEIKDSVTRLGGTTTTKSGK